MDFPDFAGVILCHGSHYFMIERSTASKHWPLHWGFPGGKKEADETIEAAAIREIQEEIGVIIKAKDLTEWIDIFATYIDGSRESRLFLVRDWLGNPENLEPDIHKNIGWFTLDELPSPIIPHIREGFLALLEGKASVRYTGI